LSPQSTATRDKTVSVISLIELSVISSLLPLKCQDSTP